MTLKLTNYLPIRIRTKYRNLKINSIRIDKKKDRSSFKFSF